MTFDLTAKRIDLLKELLPSLSRLAIVYVVRTAPDPVDDEQMRKDVAKTAEALGISWNVFYPTNENVDEIFAQIAADRFDAAYVWTRRFLLQTANRSAKWRFSMECLPSPIWRIRKARASSHLRARPRRSLRRRSGVH